MCACIGFMQRRAGGVDASAADIDVRMAQQFMKEVLMTHLAEVKKCNPLAGLMFGGLINVASDAGQSLQLMFVYTHSLTCRSVITLDVCIHPLTHSLTHLQLTRLLKIRSMCGTAFLISSGKRY